MKTRILLLFALLSMISLSNALNYSNSVFTGMESYLYNPAFLSGDRDCGVSYLFDYNDNREQMLTFRFPRYFAYSYDFDNERYYLGGAISPLRNLHTGILMRKADDTLLDFGALYRPFNQISLGWTVYDFAHEKPDMNLGLAVRPYRDYLTLYAEQEIFWNYSDEEYSRDYYFMGAVLRPFNGLEFDANYDQDENWQIMLRIGLDHLSVGYLSQGKESDSYNTRQIVTWSAVDWQSLFTPGNRMEIIKVGNGFTTDDSGFSFMERQKGDFRILEKIREAEANPKVRNILLHVQQPDASFAQLEEIRNELMRFRKHGKVACYLDYADLKSLYLASAADYIVASPAACVDLSDTGQTLLQWSGLLDELDIDVESWQVGEKFRGSDAYKESELPGDLKEQVLALRRQAIDDVKRAIKESRSITQDITALPSPMTASQALEAGLIDEEGYIGNAENFLKPSKRFPEPRIESLEGMVSMQRDWAVESRIALIDIQGNIMPGEDRDCILPLPMFGGKIAGLDRIMRQLERAENGSIYKAIVLRIDSGGGDVAAVSSLWNRIREINRRKPVVISCSGICASGAYYLALPAERIFVDRYTVSGGFGVTAYRFDAGGLFSKLGLRSEMIYATEANGSEYQNMASVYYRQLLTRISSARDIPMIEVNRLGEGYLLVGSDVLTRGLADEIGGIEDAIRYAKHRAGLSEKAHVEPISEPFSFHHLLPSMKRDFPLKNGFYMHSGLNRGL